MSVNAIMKATMKVIIQTPKNPHQYSDLELLPWKSNHLIKKLFVALEKLKNISLYVY